MESGVACAGVTRPVRATSAGSTWHCSQTLAVAQWPLHDYSHPPHPHLSVPDPTTSAAKAITSGSLCPPTSGMRTRRACGPWAWRTRATISTRVRGRHRLGTQACLNYPTAAGLPVILHSRNRQSVIIPQWLLGAGAPSESAASGWGGNNWGVVSKMAGLDHQ